MTIIDPIYLQTENLAYNSVYSYIRNIRSLGRTQSFNLCNLNLNKIPIYLFEIADIKMLFFGHCYIDIRTGSWIYCQENELSNNISSVPNELNLLQNLKILCLDNNDIKSLDNLTLFNLEYLDISHNNIHSIDLEKFPMLKVLMASNNNLIELLNIEKHKNLSYLDITNNDLKLGEQKRIHIIQGCIDKNKRNRIRCNLDQFNFLELNYTKPSGKGTIYYGELKLDYLNISSFDDFSIDRNITSLNLNGNKLSSLNGIEKYPDLIHLSIMDNQLTDISPLKNLPELETLKLTGNSIVDLSPIQSLRNLRELEIGENYFKIFDSSIINKNLKKLNISCSDLDSLNLKNLNIESLNISGCNIYDCNLIDLPYLANLKTSLLTIGSFIFKNLPKLSTINLRKTQLINISIKNLKSLHHLDLADNQITSLLILESTPSLKQICLSQNRINHIDSILELVKNNYQLTYIDIFKNPFVDIAEGLIIQGNNLSVIKAYIKSLTKGVVASNSVKLIFIGNPTVGKTTLVNSLINNEFDEQISSTHGIIHKSWAVQGNKEIINVSMWDFGGQEYYHSTHRLYLTNNSIYIVVWSSDTNSEGKVNISIKPTGAKEFINTEIDCFDYRYWLFKCRSYAKDSDIIIVQNKIDLHGEQLIDPIAIKKYNVNNSNIYNLSLHATWKEQDDTNILSFKLFEKKLIKIIDNNALRMKLGTYWNKIKEFIIENRNKKEYKYISFNNFESLCKTIDPDISNELDALILYLEESSEIICGRNNNDKIVYVFIDPSWVCTKIYEILNIKVLNNHGCFYFSEIEEFTGLDNTISQILVYFMLKNELIFSSIQNIEYIAPQYLPQSIKSYNKDKRDLIKFHLEDLSEIALVIKFSEYLHGAIISRFISRFGIHCQYPTYWKNGIIFKKSDCKCFVNCITNENKIIISTTPDNKQNNTIKDIYDSFKQINNEEQKLLISTDSINFIASDILEKSIQQGINEILSTTNNKLNLNSFNFLINSTMGKTKLFISYAHDDDNNGHVTMFLNKFEKILKGQRKFPYELWTDKDLRIGEDWHSNIQEAIYETNMGLFLISQSFFASEYIELNEFYKLLERNRVDKIKLFPILFAPCSIDSWPELNKLQIFMPKGNKYNLENIENISFMELAFRSDMPENNPIIDKYFMELADKLNEIL